jgi:hypothetical protein
VKLHTSPFLFKDFRQTFKNKKMKRIFLGALGVAALFTVSCKKDLISEDVQKPLIIGATVDTLVGTISVNTTLTKTTYLQGIVFVDSLVTLTVNPGVTIKGSLGGAVPDLVNFANNKGTLIVRRGAMLNAVGTASQPIVWTSEKTAGTRNYGDWGGIVVLGKATTVTSSGGAEGLYEAFQLAPNKVPFTYGAVVPVDNDNSGSIRYNRIEFAGGVVLQANQEVNGLTLCGVGSGTQVEYVEVSNSGDDAFEFFGGRVSAKHLISFGNKDDDYDFDEGYVGNLQFIVAYRNDLADNSGSEFIELDNNSASATFAGKAVTRPTIANATFIGPSSLTVRAGSGGRFDGGVYVRRSGKINFANSIVYADVLPAAIGVTTTTRVNIDNLPGSLDPAYIRYNMWQTVSATPVVWDNDESNQIVDGTATAIPDFVLTDTLGNATQKNSAYASLAAMGVNAGTLQLLSGSPAKTGGLSLTFLDPFFTNTIQRGAVIDADPWTVAAGTWISIAVN